MGSIFMHLCGVFDFSNIYKKICRHRFRSSPRVMSSERPKLTNSNDGVSLAIIAIDSRTEFSISHSHR